MSDLLLCCPAVGPGCADLNRLGPESVVEYYLVNDELYANVSCRDGLYFVGTHLSTAVLHCAGDRWDRHLGECAGESPSTRQSSCVAPASVRLLASPCNLCSHFESTICTVLDVVFSIFLVVLLLCWKVPDSLIFFSNSTRI